MNNTSMMIAGAVVLGVGAAWFLGQEKEASASSSVGPVWRWSATNVQLEGGPGEWEVWLQKPDCAISECAFVMGGDNFDSKAGASAAAVAYIRAHGGTPVEFTG